MHIWTVFMEFLQYKSGIIILLLFINLIKKHVRSYAKCSLVHGLLMSEDFTRVLLKQISDPKMKTYKTEDLRSWSKTTTLWSKTKTPWSKKKKPLLYLHCGFIIITLLSIYIFRQIFSRLIAFCPCSFTFTS